MTNETATRSLIIANAVILAAFAGTEWSTPGGPPDATKVPAVWAQLGNGRQSARLSTVTVESIAVTAAQVNAATQTRLADAIDRLVTGWTETARNGWSLNSWSWQIDTIDIGGADYPAVRFSSSLDMTANCTPAAPAPPPPPTEDEVNPDE
jgi:hypothetical protein